MLSNSFQADLLILESSPEINLSTQCYQALLRYLTSERTGKYICLTLFNQKGCARTAQFVSRIQSFPLQFVGVTVRWVYEPSFQTRKQISSVPDCKKIHVSMSCVELTQQHQLGSAELPKQTMEWSFAFCIFSMEKMLYSDEWPFPHASGTLQQCLTSETNVIIFLWNLKTKNSGLQVLVEEKKKKKRGKRNS